MSGAAAGNGWLHSGTVEVLLPSGTRVRLARPSLRHLIRHGILPAHLHEPALRGADRKWLTEPGKQDERQASVAEFLAVVIEWSVREVQVPGGDWVTVHLDATTVPGVDVDDLDAIEDVILRDKTPAQVSRASALELGLELLPDDEEVGVPELSEFRGQPGGPAGGDDSGDLGDQAVPDAGAGG